MTGTTTPPTTVAIERLPHGADLPLPRYETALAAGLDLRAAIDGRLELSTGERGLVSTGIKIALPPGTEAQVRPRSGLAVRHGLTIVNAPGTIDADYRGEIKVCLINLGPVPVEIERGMRIAQLVVAPVLRIEWREGTGFDETDRGEGGFGSTGEGANGGKEVIEAEYGRQRE